MVSGPSEITHIVVDPFILSERDERYTKFKEIFFTTFEKKTLYIITYFELPKKFDKSKKIVKMSLGEIIQFNLELRKHRKNL